MTINEGARIPAVELAAPDGRRIALGDFAGKPLVLYFYPKDDTAGCTREAQDFSAALADFRDAGAQILGISRDTPAKHGRFIEKYDLSVQLASDETGAAMEAFGVWIEKSLYGRKYMGIDRSTFLFDRSGQLVRSWRKVRVPGHVAAVLEAVKGLA
ncbi:MAG: peroxiredoxin [Sphingomonas sp.]